MYDYPMLYLLVIIFYTMVKANSSCYHMAGELAAAEHDFHTAPLNRYK